VGLLPSADWFLGGGAVRSDADSTTVSAGGYSNTNSDIILMQADLAAEVRVRGFARPRSLGAVST